MRFVVFRCLVLAGVFGAAFPSRAADDPWVKVTAEHFTVLTTAGEPVARKWAVELVEFSRALQAMVPVPVEKLRPVTVVLFRNERAMEPYLPRENGQPARIGGLFVRTNDLNTIMLSLAQRERDARHIIFHEAVHWHLDALHQRLPLWLGEGLAELFASFEVTDDTHCQFGVALPAHLDLLNSGRLPPVAQIVATQRGSVLYNESRRGNPFYAGAWALVHFLLLSDGAPGPAALQQFIALQQRGAKDEDAFRAAFGTGYSENETQLRRYLRERRFRAFVRPYASADVTATVAAPPDGEIELARGALLLGARDAATAEPVLRRAAELAPRDPRAWEMLGVTLATQAGADGTIVDVAAGHFRRAIELEPQRISSYEGLAGSIYGMATFRPEDATLLAQGLALAPDNLVLEAGVAACEIRAGRSEAGLHRLERVAAHDAGTDSLAHQYAVRILTREKVKAELAEVQRLASERRFRDALSILDRALTRDLTPAERELFVGLRRGLGMLVK